MTDAMACGTPVLAWRNGSAPEVVAGQSGGFVVDSLDELAAALDRVSDLDPGRVRVEERFSAEAMVVGEERIYQQIATKVMKRLAPSHMRIRISRGVEV
jgi:glycosyltransferase involved in cell wall biosynthesis